MTAPLEVRGLTKRFGHVLAVDDLSFTVEPGRVTGFLGPNGAGKTTTLRMLLGLVTPTQGSALVNGVPYRSLPDPTATVGAVLEASGVHPARTARNHLRAVATVSGIGMARIDEVLGLVGLADAADRAAGGFSLGMRQRLELARALLGDPVILILDEPANGLDPQGIAWLRDFLRHFASEGKVVLVSSHLLAEASQTVDDVVILSGGRLAAQGTLESLLEQGSKKEVLVRTPDRARLLEVLAAAGMPATAEGDLVAVADATAEAVGPVMAAERIVVHEMTSSAESLEDLFFTLTEGQEFQSPTGPPLAGPPPPEGQP